MYGVGSISSQKLPKAAKCMLCTLCLDHVVLCTCALYMWCLDHLDQLKADVLSLDSFHTFLMLKVLIHISEVSFFFF